METYITTTQHEIDGYVLFHMTDNFGHSTIIHCYGGGLQKGTLFFYKEGMTTPASSKSSAGFLSLRFREQQLPEMLATLRQEKPLYTWFDDGFQHGELTTSTEPIGEEES